MGSEWKTKDLKDCATWYSGGTPRKENPEYWGGNIPWISAKSLKNFFVSDSEEKITEAGLDNGTRLVPQNSILFIVRGMSLKTEFRMGITTRPVAFNQDLKALVANEDTLPYFLAYAIRGKTLEILDLVGEAGHGTGVIPTDRIQAIQIPCLALKEQQRIVDFLKALDDKIELNRRMNATLERMAQALFKSWFVDFDPVIDNALAAGNPIPEELTERAEVRRKALADGTANREAAKQFPAAFQLTEEMGWIPEGWEVKPLGSILRSVSDTYPLKTVDKVVFLNTGDILDGRFLHQDLSETISLPGQAKKSIRKDDILYSEIRPKNRRFAYVYFDSPKHVVSTKLMVLRATNDVSSMFIYLILKQDSTINYLQMMAESRSGTFPQITFDILSKIEITLPKDLELVTKFTEIFLKPTFQKQLMNDAMSEELTGLRDTLLPKLISGELRIPEAESLVEEALA